jgi:AhpD family alkylhydroperoxidase
MEARIDYLKVGRGVYEAMLGLEKYLHQCGLEEKLVDLIKLRVSQINGCAYCIDMHWKDLRGLGEREQRLYGLDAWEESPYYTDLDVRPWPGRKRLQTSRKPTRRTMFTRTRENILMKKNSLILPWPSPPSMHGTGWQFRPGAYRDCINRHAATS